MPFFLRLFLWAFRIESFEIDWVLIEERNSIQILSIFHDFTYWIYFFSKMIGSLPIFRCIGSFKEISNFFAQTIRRFCARQYNLFPKRKEIPKLDQNSKSQVQYQWLFIYYYQSNQNHIDNTLDEREQRSLNRSALSPVYITYHVEWDGSRELIKQQTHFNQFRLNWFSVARKFGINFVLIFWNSIQWKSS